MTRPRLDPGLPRPTGVSTEILAGAFRNVTTSYKHLFFRSLLREIAAGRHDIPHAQIALGMMEEAWWPGFHYRLNLGARDMVASRIAYALQVDSLRRDPHAVRRALEGAVTGSRDPLLRFVPQRFLRPWFAAETHGLPDHRVDAEISRLSRSRESPAPYRIEPGRIVVAEDLMRFLADNLAFVQGWSDALWIAYLEARNPGVPGLQAKISPALSRPSLADQSALWRAAMQEHPVRCIYTGAPLTPERIAVDHFVPRAFVSHDRMWNLTPTTPEINGAKSDHLPDPVFVPRLAFQHARLARAADRLGGRPAAVWRRALDEMASDLRIDAETVERPDDLCRAYEDVLGSLTGIGGGWDFPTGGGRPPDLGPLPAREIRALGRQRRSRDRFFVSPPSRSAYIPTRQQPRTRGGTT